MVIAVIGSGAMWMLYGWLLSAIIASWLSGRKGYTERPGLALGLLIPVISVIVWLIIPAKPDSDWKVLGPFRRQKADGPEPSGS